VNAHPHRYAGYRSRIPNAHIARALGDVDDVLREAVKADNLRREAHPANDRFSGPPRHYRIGVEPPFPLWLKVYLVVAFVGSLAIWCVS
jgi:hypothetical protein